MIVDSRYEKVGEGKSRLGALILTQGFIQLVAAVVLYLSTVERGTLDRLSASSIVISFISLLIGEFGRKHSRDILLKLYLFGSSVAALISVVRVLRTEKSIEVMKGVFHPSYLYEQGLSGRETPKFEVFMISIVTHGVVVQIIAFIVATLLIHNMAPPMKAS